MKLINLILSAAAVTLLSTTAIAADDHKGLNHDDKKGGTHAHDVKPNGATSATAAANRASAFVALRMDTPAAIVGQAPAGCTLLLGCGLRLEMATLPAPEWLAALGRAAQGTR